MFKTVYNGFKQPQTPLIMQLHLGPKVRWDESLLYRQEKKWKCTWLQFMQLISLCTQSLRVSHRPEPVPQCQFLGMPIKMKWKCFWMCFWFLWLSLAICIVLDYLQNMVMTGFVLSLAVYSPQRLPLASVPSQQNKARERGGETEASRYVMDPKVKFYVISQKKKKKGFPESNLRPRLWATQLVPTSFPPISYPYPFPVHSHTYSETGTEI